MSLREGLRKIEVIFEDSNGCDYKFLDDLSDESMDEVINKILDAAVEAVKSCERIMWQPKIDKDNPPILDSDVDSDSVIKAINKLRYEK